jgi:hypothetical protein
MVKRILKWIFLVIGIASCAKISVWMTKNKVAIYSNSAQSRYARAFFWKTLHTNQVKDIPRAETLLMQAYLANTNDPILASYIAFLHIWKLTERNFLNPNPLIVNEIELAQAYFEKVQVKAYFKLKDAIAMWPEFNYFTAGYPRKV